MATTSFSQRHRCSPPPLPLPSLCFCPCRPSPSRTLVFNRPSAKLGNLDLLFDGNRRQLGLGRNRGFARRRVITAVARGSPQGRKLSSNEDVVSEHQQKASQLKKRIVFGFGIGLSVAVVVLAGGRVFTAAVAAAVFIGAREYFELVRSRGITDGMTPPPRYVSRVCSVICALMPLVTLYRGQIDVSVTSASFFVAIALLLQRGNPRFAQLSSTMFGLFYCGYLPCFWVKLRCGLAAPGLHTRIGAAWPILLGGQAHWTVGLVATLISFSSIIAADTYAFVGGKAFGRTPLTSVSPKKTWEGAIVGLGGCIATSVVLSRIFCWPKSLLRNTQDLYWFGRTYVQLLFLWVEKSWLL
ncbi:hypothetical protein D8674_020394 [Pyrus ussuriensis x Pyrus communis]|uniref:phosphatidate cytidylyltransferase n=1 Tax=Pyrus ussuriensis x Pyrus communis TaxID=2448454 RepID=A0A5N5HFJ8_9ROSA|nr:hypothetical protein D8674_020394 [Pyrus ussuriensis x Pyrus communis]